MNLKTGPINCKIIPLVNRNINIILTISIYYDTIYNENIIYKGGFEMYEVINSWIEYLHPKLGYPIIARIEDEKEIKEKYKIVKKIINNEIVPIEAE